MARRSVTGQLNMFDFFSSGDAGEVEMVSLMPSFEAEPIVEPEPEPVVELEPVVEPEPVIEPEPFIEHETIIEPEKPVMSRVYELNGEKVEVAYINYNKVRVTKGNEAPKFHEFSNSKEAVDFYVGYMQELEQ